FSLLCPYYPLPSSSPHSFPTRRSSDLVLPVLAQRVRPRGAEPAARVQLQVARGDRPAGARQRRAAGRSALSRTSWSISSRDLKLDRKSTRLNSSHLVISDAVFCLK